MRFFFIFFCLWVLPLHADFFEKKSDDFYVGKIEGRDLWLVMERVKTQEKASLWVDCAYRQGNLLAYYQSLPEKSWLVNYGLDGLAYFVPILTLQRNEPEENLNHVWVAYITKNKDPKPLQKDDLTEIYGRARRNSIGGIEKVYAGGDTPFTQNIMMVMTVRCVDDAPITSHMGIQKTVEGLGAGVKNISLSLHSFAARVMLDEDSSRQLMINAPVEIVAKMIAEALPEGAVALSRREDHDLRRRMMQSPDYIKMHNVVYNVWYDWPSLDIFEKYPPRLSYDTENVLIERNWEKRVKGRITLYKDVTSDEVMMTFCKIERPEAYHMLCDNLSGATYFIVVDLKALAALTPLFKKE